PVHPGRSVAVAGARAVRAAAPRSALHPRSAPDRRRRADARSRRLGHRVTREAPPAVDEIDARDPDELDASLAMHDELIARRGVEIWIGAEPTFTRADSLDPAWASDASGDDKLARAHALAVALGDRLPGATVSRVVGRQFPDEAEPRFAFGVRWRDGSQAPGSRCAADAVPELPPADPG